MAKIDRSLVRTDVRLCAYQCLALSTEPLSYRYLHSLTYFIGTILERDVGGYWSWRFILWRDYKIKMLDNNITYLPPTINVVTFIKYLCYTLPILKEVTLVASFQL